jgi:glycosyltransferase involved in cell wall biosynthesis
MISIIFFGYNEGKNIRKCVESIIGNLTGNNFEIIIINDGSIDNTADEINKIQSNKYEIKKINKNKNEGIARAVYDGLKLANGEYVSWLPSDGAYDEKTLNDLFKQNINKKDDLYIGYRSNKKERVYIRFFLSEFLTLVLNCIFFKKIKDYNGVVLLNKRVLQDIKLPNHPSFQWVIIMQLLKKKIKYTEFPIRMTMPEPGDGSSAMNLKTFKSYFFSLIKLVKIIFFKS